MSETATPPPISKEMRRQNSQDEAGEEIESLLLGNEKSHDQTGLLPNHVIKSPDHMPHCNDSSLVLVNKISVSPSKQYSLTRSPDKWLGKSYSDADLRSMEKCTVTENKLALQGSVRKNTSKGRGSLCNNDKGAVVLSGSLADDAFSTFQNYSKQPEILELKDLSMNTTQTPETRLACDNSNEGSNGDMKDNTSKIRNKKGTKFKRQMSDTSSVSPPLSSSSGGSSSICSLQGAAALKETCSPDKEAVAMQKTCNLGGGVVALRETCTPNNGAVGLKETNSQSKKCNNSESDENLSKLENRNGNEDHKRNSVDKSSSVDIPSPKKGISKEQTGSSYSAERQSRIQILQRELARIQRELKSLGELEVEISYV